jgi:redox-sensitive bicupin YhaK (pirin superfamily)
MKKIIHKSFERGKTELGWLHSLHSFSFGSYYDPDKMGFGLLRVLNDDTVEPGKGFGTHPHNNMEIISIVLNGALEHKDSMGGGSVIYKGDVQVMSAGTGVTHSEFNHSRTELVQFLQIWIIPNERGLKPRYDQKHFDLKNLKNKILTVVSGDKLDSKMFINQNAAISIGSLEKGKVLRYNNIYNENGIYLFVLEGSINLDNEYINERDAVGIYDTDGFNFNASSNTKFIIIEVPMK